MANLATTASADVVGASGMNRRHVDPNWYVGKGKAEDLVAAKRETGFDLLVADDGIANPAAGSRVRQSRSSIRPADPDIFALHAQTHEGRLRSAAQLEYQLPRLTRLWTHLSRTQGRHRLPRPRPE